MLKPLIKVTLQKLDVAVEAYLERQQIINLLAIPGTILFLMLFWAFSGAGGVVVVLGLFFTAVEVGLAAGLFLLRDKYEDQVREWSNAADAIEAHLNDTDVFGEWTEFLQKPANDPALERMRVQCEKLPDRCPPTSPDAYCGPEGIRLLRSTVEGLRVGIVSKAYADFLVWWAERKARDTDLDDPTRPAGSKTRTKKKRRKKRRKKTTARRRRQDADQDFEAVRSVPTLSSSFLAASTQDRVDREADEEVEQDKKQQQREAKKASRVARKATRRAVKQEKKQRKRSTMLDSLDDEVLLYEDEPEVSTRPTMRAPAAAPVEDPIEDDYVEEEEEYEEEHEEQVAPPPPPRPAPSRQVISPPAPSPKPPKKRRTTGMTEVAAIQRVLKAGFSAHDFDATHEQLTARQGRDVKPAEVVKTMLTRQKADRKRRTTLKSSGPPKIARGTSFRRSNNAAFRIDGDPMLGGHRPHREPSRAKTVGRVIVVFAVLLSVPFATWRFPNPEARPVVITGEVHHRILDKAPDVQHKLRTPFERLFGNKAVMLLDGQRIYVNAKDYKRCWPESWSAIYEQGYSVVITAEVRLLIFGGYSVATITSAERVDRPVATVTEFIDEPVAPPEAQWIPRRHLERGMK